MYYQIWKSANLKDILSGDGSAAVARGNIALGGFISIENPKIRDTATFKTVKINYIMNVYK